jgi:ABC-type multidrug transport system fused ATPase/permease subunit
LNNQSIYKLLKRLWCHISLRHRKQFFAVFFLMIIASFAEVVSIGAVIPFLSAITAPEKVFSHPLSQPLIEILELTSPTQLILVITLGFSVAAIFSGFMRLVLLWVQTHFSYSIGADFSISMYKKTLYQPYSIHLERNSSEVISTISNKTLRVVLETLFPTLVVLSSTIMIFVVFFTLILIDPKMAILILTGFGGLYLIVIKLTKKRLSYYSNQISHEQNQVIKILQEGLGGIRDVIIDGSQTFYCKLYGNADLPLRRAQANVNIISNSPRFIIEAISLVAIAMLALQLAQRTEGISSAITMLGALGLGAQRLLPVLQQGYHSFTWMRGSQALLNDVLDFLDQTIPDYVDEKNPPIPIDFHKSICIENVFFRYKTSEPLIINNLNLEIIKGSRVGFIGKTGSGKSTLLDIVMGLLQPSAGNLKCDGVILTPNIYRNWQARIAHVPQIIFLSDNTIAENIAFGTPLNNIDLNRVKEAACKAQISQTIEGWDQQYNTVVGEHGVRLSGGQRQRIGIARALYRNADIIVLDEATSALDEETEQEVMQSIYKLSDNITVLIVAHRLTTLKHCTQIVELGDGSVKRIGNFDEIVGTLPIAQNK